jgi:hypothetical protein
MSAISDSLAGAIASLEVDGGMTITLPDGTVAPCVVSMIENDREAMEGGQWITYSGTAVIRASLVNMTPRQGNQVIYNGQTMHVGKVSVNSNLGFISLQLSSTPMPK